MRQMRMVKIAQACQRFRTKMGQNRSLKVGKHKIMGHISNFKLKMHYILYFEAKKSRLRERFVPALVRIQENLDFNHVAPRERRFAFGTDFGHRWV